ncbi:MAG TPA: hypothetical protein VGP77_01610 [Vicinamibacterales bacterium]|jgi:hypothetical protein|nr:hypothetical protein [Vicinamibacterales bacterium]
MATERSRQLVLGGLVVALILILVKVWPGTSAAPPPASNRTANTSAPRPQTGAAESGAPVVHLQTLNDDRPRPAPAERNLFRFRTRAPAPSPSPAVTGRVQPAVPAMPAGPPLPPPLAPITLKFIGLIGPDNAKIAILSDGQNPPFLGKEGAIIEGRYRILKIGVESVELAYADGRGRQTIRLTGS